MKPPRPSARFCSANHQRLRVRELSFEQVERGLQRRELFVLELELRKEVLLRPRLIAGLFAGELVALRVQRHSERDQLGAVGIEPPRERLVGHLLVALHVLLASRAVSGLRSAIRNATRDNWRISLSVSCDRAGRTLTS